MSDTKYLKQIQSRLSRKGIKASYKQIRPVLLEHCSDTEQPNEERLSAVVEHFTSQTTETLSLDAQTTELPAAVESNTLTTTQSSHLQQRSPQDLIPSELPQTVNLAPQEAIAIIQEIASDDTSRNKQVAEQLLAQANEKTDTMVALIAAIPDIEAEMLKRKLQKMQPKRVDYEGILDNHFRQSQELTTHLQGLVGEYGISL